MLFFVTPVYRENLMNGILQWGVDVVLWFQQFRPTLDIPFIAFTYTGEEMFFLLFLPLITWCINKDAGIRLMILFLLNTYFNSIAKSVADQPRPFQINSRVKAVVHAGGGGFPSGHTQNALVVWSYLAYAFKKRWLWAPAVIMMIFVPMSRIYLGVHFPTDLLGGYILGLIILILYIKLEIPARDWLKEKSIGIQLSFSILIPLLLVLVMPKMDSHGIATCGTLLGGCAGLTLEQKWIRCEVPNGFFKKIISYLIGIVVLFIFYVGLKKAFNELEPEPVFRFVRYSVLGFHFLFIAPWLFVRFKLSGADNADN